MPNKNSTPWPLMLLPLALLLSGCASESPSYPVDPPRVPPLAKEARQPTPPAWCSPTCSAGLTQQRESWLRMLTAPE